MQDSNSYIKLVFPRHLILNMLRIRHYKNSCYVFIYLGFTVVKNIPQSIECTIFSDLYKITILKMIIDLTATKMLCKTQLNTWKKWDLFLEKINMSCLLLRWHLQYSTQRKTLSKVCITKINVFTYNRKVGYWLLKVLVNLINKDF